MQKLFKPFVVFVNLIRLLYTTFLKLILSLTLYRNIKVYLCNDFTIGILTLYRFRIKFPHPVGIVIGGNVKLGYDCVIYQNVTIGTKETKTHYKFAKYPKIGDNVTIFPNAVLIGDIHIGSNAVIAAGAIVLSDVPENSIAIGVPAKVKRIQQ